MGYVFKEDVLKFICEKVSLDLFMKRSVAKADEACWKVCEMIDAGLPVENVIENEKENFLDMLNEIRYKVWLYDIPSPAVPEYIEHHEQITDILKLIDEKIKECEKL